MSTFSGTDILALSEILRAPENDGEGRDQGVTGQYSSPADFGPAKGAIVAKSSASAMKGETERSDKKDIWDDTEVLNEEDVEDPHDKRPAPQYEILYRQDVMTEDVYLGLGDKTPGSEHCNTMVVKVNFPGAKMSDLDLDVTKQKFKVESKNLKLSVYLPYAVDHEHGNAKWDTKKELLIVALPIDRDEE